MLRKDINILTFDVVFSSIYIGLLSADRFFFENACSINWTADSGDQATAGAGMEVRGAAESSRCSRPTGDRPMPSFRALLARLQCLGFRAGALLGDVFPFVSVLPAFSAS